MASSASMTRLEEASKDGRLLREAFSCFPSGIVALCSVVDGCPVGMVASTFAGVSLSPPLVSVCIQRTSATWMKLRNAQRIGVSCLSAEQGGICMQLAGKSGDRFIGVEWLQTEAEAILLENATVAFDCKIHSEIPAGDHEIVLLEIIAVQMDPSALPLVFHGSAFKAVSTQAKSPP